MDYVTPKKSMEREEDVDVLFEIKTQLVGPSPEYPPKGPPKYSYIQKTLFVNPEVDGFDPPTYIDGSGNEYKEPRILEVYGDEDRGKEGRNAFDIPPVTLTLQDPDSEHVVHFDLGHCLKIGGSGHQTDAL